MATHVRRLPPHDLFHPYYTRQPTQFPRVQGFFNISSVDICEVLVVWVPEGFQNIWFLCSESNLHWRGIGPLFSWGPQGFRSSIEVVQ